MRRNWVVSILICLVASPALAAVPGAKLAVKYSPSNDTFSVTVTPNFSAAGCRFDVYGSTSRQRLERNATRGQLLVSLKGGAAASSASGTQIDNARFSARRLPVFFRARTHCGPESEQTKIRRLTLRESAGQGGVKIKRWFRGIRGRLLVATISVTRSFPNLSFEAPVDFQSPNDGTNRIFVVEQRGTIQSFTNDQAANSKTLFLDISSKLVFVDEQGLLGLAFHPSFASNGFFYVNYTRSGDGATVIARYTADINNPGQVDPATESVVMIVEQPFSNHNGGGLAFGPDGNLYIALGDGGSGGDPQGNGQKVSTLLGKILRVDVNRTSSLGNYAIPADNPFVGNTNGTREEIYALGLRNPWRITFDSTNGALWTGDVGQNSIEEVDVITAGGNYGWNVLEGTSCFSSQNCNRTGLIAPVAEYTHAVGESITGGYVYRGSVSPNLAGFYVYGDFISGRIFALDRAKDVLVVELIDSSINISSFGVDAQKELYLLSYSDGVIYSIGQ